MSAFVCGKSSSFFQEFSTTTSLSKKRNRCSTSPLPSSPITTTNKNSTNSPFATVSRIAGALDRLQFLLPAIEMKVLQKALEESLEELDDFESAIMSLIQRCLDPSIDVDDDQNWFFEEEAKKRSKQVSDDITSSGYGNGNGCTWPPRARYLPEADIYALPYTVPF